MSMTCFLKRMCCSSTEFFAWDSLVTPPHFNKIHGALKPQVTRVFSVGRCRGVGWQATTKTRTVSNTCSTKPNVEYFLLRDLGLAASVPRCLDTRALIAYDVIIIMISFEYELKFEFEFKCIRAFPDRQYSRGRRGAHLGSIGPRWAPHWPRDSCYLDHHNTVIRHNSYTIYHQCSPVWGMDAPLWSISFTHCHCSVICGIHTHTHICIYIYYDCVVHLRDLTGAR